MNSDLEAFIDLMILQREETGHGKNTNNAYLHKNFEYFVNPYLKGRLAEIRKNQKIKIEKMFSFVPDMLKNENNTQFLYELFWNSGADPCEDVIIYCKLKGKETECNELFHIMPTSVGPCCMFNLNLDTFKASYFSEVSLV